MPRTKVATRKPVGTGKGQSSSRHPVASREISEEQQKRRQDRGKRPAPTNSEDEEDSSQEESGSEEAADSHDEIGDDEEQEINLRTISADAYTVMRQSNQFIYPANSKNPRFHTKF